MKHHLALFVTGHSPAIVTETLAALHADPPDEVRVCTTSAGAETLCRSLFEQQGWASFQTSYPRYAETVFDESCIIFNDELADIRNGEDNKVISQSILSMVSDGVKKSSRVTASIAGGRKTMGYLMGFAMSLYGRPQDRLTHVLVPPEWEANRSFLFPEPDDLDSIDLVDIPFIRLRGHLKASISNADIDTLAESAQSAINLSALEPMQIRIRRRSVEAYGKSVTFSEREFSFLQFFAEQKLRNCCHPKRPTCDECRDCFLGYDEIDAKKDDLLRIRAQFGGVDSGNYVRFETSWDSPRPSSTNLHDPLRRLAEEVEKVFVADPRAECLLVRNVGKRGEAHYGLMADKSQIRISKD